jgi:hypothetical protein
VTRTATELPTATVNLLCERTDGALVLGSQAAEHSWCADHGITYSTTSFRRDLRTARGAIRRVGACTARLRPVFCKRGQPLATVSHAGWPAKSS